MKQITDKDKHFMREAIRLADESVLRGGGPFGAVIVKDGEIIAGSSNSVTIDQDPTAHAEVNTIREACRKLGTFDLTGCTIYTSCEPCPMCLGAIYWARISRIFYGNTRPKIEPQLAFCIGTFRYCSCVQFAFVYGITIGCVASTFQFIANNYVVVANAQRFSLRLSEVGNFVSSSAA